MRSLLDRPDVRVQLAGHETFPCRYGWLKKAFDAIDLADGEEGRRKVFATDPAIAVFGVGKNMVSSIRHWSLACGTLESRGGKGKLGDLVPSDLGRLILEAGDPYLERPASLWALHWRLVSNPGRATTWYYAFNEFNDAIFSREVMSGKLVSRLEELREIGSLTGGRIARATVERDVECLIRTYVPRTGARAGAEDSLECPFAELGLIVPLAGVGAVQFRRGPKPSMPDEVFAFALVEFWRDHFGTRGSLTIETVTHEPGSPGRAFLLDEESVIERLERIEQVTDGALTWDESTGLRQVSARTAISAINPTALLSRVYAQTRLAA